MKNSKISKKQIIKKINYQLNGNFFTYEEFCSLKFREAKKVIKQISKIQGLKLKRKQIIEITKNILNLKFNNLSLNSIANFFGLFIEELKSKIKKTYLLIKKCFFIFVYRKDREMILRI